ncbi:MAG: hypothetical protein ACOY3L_03680 [Pseudomonadota bacterium]
MERKIASRIVEATVSLNKAIGALDTAITDIPDQQEKRRYVAALGNMLHVLTVDILHEILKDYPDLNPYDK